jgi:uncharacterized protein (DUF302 family)
MLHVEKVIKENGFGILYTIDFWAMSLKKRQVSIGKYIQVGMCHPDIWFALLDNDKSFGSLLPCPLCVYEEEGKILVSIVDSQAQLSVHPLYTPSMLTQEATWLIDELFKKL